MRLDIEFADGRVGATADGDRVSQLSAKGKPRARGSGSGGRQLVWLVAPGEGSLAQPNDYV
jgi:hypothetical protein